MEQKTYIVLNLKYWFINIKHNIYIILYYLIYIIKHKSISTHFLRNRIRVTYLR